MNRIKIIREIQTKSSIAKTRINNNYNQEREQGLNDRIYKGSINSYPNKSKKLNRRNISHTNPIIQSKSRFASLTNKGLMLIKKKNEMNKNYWLNEHSDFTEIENSTSLINNNFLYLNVYEQEKKLKKLWEELCVNDNYRQIYEDMTKNLNDQSKNEIFKVEIDNLLKLKEALLKMKHEMQKRQKIILLLQKLEERVSHNNDNNNNLNSTIPNDLFHDIIKAIQSLRMYSINVVFYINRVRELFAYNSSKGKFIIQKLHTNFSFDPLYLIKMQNDLDFLYKSSLMNYWDFAERGDPFLIAIENIIPIAKEDNKDILQSQYLILQDIIFSQLSEISNDDTINNSNINNKGINAPSKIQKIQLEAKEKNLNKVNRFQIDINEDKGVDNDSGDEIDKENKGIKKLKQLEEEKKKEIEKERESEKIKNVIKVKGQLKKKEREFEEVKRKETDKIKREDEKKKEEGKNKNKKESQMIDKEKDKELKEMSNIEVQIEEDIDNYEEKENRKELKHKKENNQNKITKKIKPKSPKKNDSLTSTLQRSMSPETRRKKIQDNFKTKIFNGNLKHFIQAYKSYYPKIPQNLKDIFNIKEDLLLSITPFYNPKIIICTDHSSKSKNQNQIEGICIFYFDISTPLTPKVIISHLSSSNQSEPMSNDMIILMLINYIKEFVECSEIYIDLYYKYNEKENKFTIDTEIRDFFKKTLLFKWVKLENLSNHIRYQKMLLKLQKTKEEIKYEEESNLNVSRSFIESIGNNNKKGNIKKIKAKGIISINNYYITGLFKEKEEKNINDKYMNLFSFSFILNQLKDKENYDIKSEDEKKTQLINWNLSDKEILVNNTKFDFNKDIKLIENQINIEIPKEEYKKAECISSLNLTLTPIIPSNISGIINKIPYNRIENNISTFYYKDKSNTIYLIPTNDEQNSFIIGKMTPTLRTLFLDNDDNIYSIFTHELYPNLIHNTENEHIVLWVPSFSIDTHLSSGQLSNLKCVEISKDNNNQYINKLDEYMKVDFSSDKQKEFNFNIEPNSNDIIIKEDFLFGIINLEVLSSFNMGCILLLNISRDNWINKEK